MSLAAQWTRPPVVQGPQDPWMGEISRALEQLSPGATSTKYHVPQPTKPWCLEIVLCNRRGQGSEMPWTPQIEALALHD